MLLHPRNCLYGVKGIQRSDFVTKSKYTVGAIAHYDKLPELWDRMPQEWTKARLAKCVPIAKAKAMP